MNGSNLGHGARPPLGQWLRAGDWQRLDQHFARQQPILAEDHAARGLMRLHTAGTPEQLSDALSDLRQAAALEPRNPLHALNLAQALIDTGQPAEALRTTEDILRRAAGFVPALEKRCLALNACSRWDDALEAFVTLAGEATAQGLALTPAVQAAGAALESRWWRPIPAGGAALRLPREDDHDAIARWLADDAFMARYHRFEPRTGQAARQHVARAQRPPHETRRREWIVQDRHGRAAGFAALVDIDASHRRAELLVGLPEADAASSLALKASVAAMAFAFERLHVDKLVSHVYGDNPLAQANTVHLGFTPEGRLREHLRIGDQRVDLLVNGLLARDHAQHPRLARLRARWLHPGADA